MLPIDNHKQVANRSGVMHASVYFLLLSLFLSCDRGPNGSHVQGSVSGFSLTPWKTQEDFGVLVKGEQREATFEVENTGSVRAILELGPKSCGCTVVKLSKSTLAPGESAFLRIGLRNGSAVGPVHGSVPLFAKGERWAYTFLVRGVAIGSWFPTNEILLSREFPKHCLKGLFYSDTVEASIKLNISVNMEKTVSDIISTSQGRISETENEAGIFYQEISFDVLINTELLDQNALDEHNGYSGTILVRLTGDDQEYSHAIPIKVW